jgi:outer membrane immunogenic protein
MSLDRFMKYNLTRELAVALLLVGSLLSAAHAADIAIKAPQPTPPPLCAWCGWYIGVNAGWTNSTHNSITNTATDTDGGGLGAILALGGIPVSISDSYSGFLGGGQVGYNWQTGIAVIGLEADIDGVSGAHGGNSSFTPIFNVGTSYTRALDWLSTVRGRVGVTVTPQVLVYATGGVAFGETKIGSSASCPTAGPPCSSEPSTTNVTTNTSVGWTLGGGLEWMFVPNWSIKAEYLYADLGSHNSTIVYAYGGGNTSSLTSTVRDTQNIVRGGIDWHFGGPVAH